MTDNTAYSLLGHNTFGIDVRCRRFMEYGTAEEAQRVADVLRSTPGQPFMVIGAGSNLLLTSDYEGTVVHSTVRGISLTEMSDGDAILSCGSGEKWDDVVAWTADMGFADLVNLTDIPGEVGATAVQNIGAYGAEVSQSLHQVLAIEIATGQRVVIDGADCGYGYRDSRFKHEWKGRYLITHVKYRLHRSAKPMLDYGDIRSELARQGMGEQPSPTELRQVIGDIRRRKLPDPAVKGNAGSFFINPIVSAEVLRQLQQRYPTMPHYDMGADLVKIPAAWLIEQCGWKGRQLGRAAVHDRQALVLVNQGEATGSDIVALCRAIQQDVSQRFGIMLQPEVNIV